MPFALPGPTIHDLDAYFSSAKGVGASVDRIGENRPDVAINRQLPNDWGFAGIARQHGYAHVLLAKPEQRLTDTSQLDRFAKDQLNRLLHALIGILLDLAARVPTETDGQEKLQFTALGLLQDCFPRPLPEEIQFELGHGALHPKEQTIIHEIRIVDSVEVHQ